MTTLIACTTLSETLLSFTFNELHRTAGDTIVIDFDDGVHAELKKHLISSIPIRTGMKFDWEKRDSLFKVLFMPGSALGIKLPTTDLEAWKMMSLDRFSFWFRPNSFEEYQYVMSLKWDVAIVPLDLHHPLPWALARYSGKEVVAVQCGPVKTREMYDIIASGSLPFSKIISGESDNMWMQKVENDREK